MSSHYINLISAIKIALKRGDKPSLSVEDWEYIIGRLQLYDKAIMYFNDKALANAPDERTPNSEYQFLQGFYNATRQTVNDLLLMEEEFENERTRSKENQISN